MKKVLRTKWLAAESQYRRNNIYARPRQDDLPALPESSMKPSNHFYIVVRLRRRYARTTFEPRNISRVLEVENIYDTLSRCILECGHLKTDSDTGQKKADKIAGYLDGKQSGKVKGTTSSNSTNSS